jgi:hypothetical protein
MICTMFRIEKEGSSAQTDDWVTRRYILGGDGARSMELVPSLYLLSPSVPSFVMQKYSARNVLCTLAHRSDCVSANVTG